MSDLGKRLSMLRRSSAAGSGTNLKPSQLKALRKKKSSGIDDSATGAAGVLKQIAAMRDALKAKTDAAPSPPTTATTQAALQDVCEEILATEANYLRDVTHTVDAYLMPLQHLVDPQQHAKVFANLQQMQQMHMILDGDLKPAAAASTRDEKAEKIAAAFKKLLPFFRMYSQYCHAYTSAGEKLMELKEAVPAARDLISAADGEAGPFLEALLFRPVQRMCVYPLLFREALKHVTGGTELHARLTELFDSVSTIIQQVNDTVRQLAETDRTAEVLLSEVGGDVAELLSASRKLCLEADVDMKLQANALSLVAPEWKIRRSYKWYVLSDLILVCRPKGPLGKQGYRKKLIIPVEEIDLDALTAAGSSSSDGGGGGGGEDGKGKPTGRRGNLASAASRAFASFPAARKTSVTGARKTSYESVTAAEKAVEAEDNDDDDDDDDAGLEEVSISLERSAALKPHGNAHHNAVGKVDRTVSIDQKAESIKRNARTISAPLTWGRRAAEKHEDKPEVLRFVWKMSGEGAEYKCWAASETARVELEQTIRKLQDAQEALRARTGIDTPQEAVQVSSPKRTPLATHDRESDMDDSETAAASAD